MGALAGGDCRGLRWIAYIVTLPNGLRTFYGKTGKFEADNQPHANYAMPGNVGAKLRRGKIHASQENYVQAVYGFRDWLLYALWNEKFYHVVDLDAPAAS